MLRANSFLSQGVLLPEFISWRRKKKPLRAQRCSAARQDFPSMCWWEESCFQDLCNPFPPRSSKAYKFLHFSLLYTHYSGLGNISKLDKH